ncbi:MAG: calcium-binding protein [Hyphomicrobium sp.]
MANVINVLTTGGGSFFPIDFYSLLAGTTSIVQGPIPATSFSAFNAPANTELRTTGTGFTYGPSGVTGGAYTKAVLLSAGVPIIEFNYSPAISIPAFNAALQAFSISGGTDTTQLDALYSAQPTTINGNTGDEILVGLDGVDIINGNAGIDVLIGEGGSDTLNPGSTRLDPFGFGFELLAGGAGNDTFNVGSSGAVHAIVSYSDDGGPNGVTVNLATNSATDTFGNTDTLNGIVFVIGTSFADSLTGDTTEDFLAPGGGTDTINGGGGLDELDYFFIAYYNSDAFNYLSGITVNHTGDNAGTVIDPFGFTDTFTNIERIAGTRFDDVFNGSAFADIFIGGNGTDTFNGNGGTDTVDYSQEVVGGALSGITINLTSGNFLDGHGNADVLSSIENIIGSRFNDSIIGDGNVNRLEGSHGNDTLNGLVGADTLIGGFGNDTYTIDNLGDLITEAAGQGTDTVVSTVNVRFDTMTSAAGVEHVVLQGATGLTGIGHNTFNTITGNSGANYLSGAGGNDTVNGGAGNDTVYGGDGKDTLTGGTGDDKFFYSFIADSGGTQPRRDVITDFSQVALNNDWIDLAATDANGALAGNQAFVWRGTAAFTGAAGELRYFQDVANNRTIIEGNVRIDVGSPGPEFSIELTGLKTLTAGANNTFDIIL